MLTLWDLLDPLLNKLAPPLKRPSPSRRPVAQRPGPKPGRSPSPSRRLTVSPPHASATAGMQASYDAISKLMLDTHRIRVRKWRTSMSGIAWYVTYRDGARVNLIEAPRPKGPMSVAIFLHEIGHHAIGFNVYKPRCLEEYHAWRWALEAMQEHKLNITDAVRLRMHRSLHYAVQKARRRGIKRIPDELTPFLTRPPRSNRRRVMA